MRPDALLSFPKCWVPYVCRMLKALQIPVAQIGTRHCVHFGVNRWLPHIYFKILIFEFKWQELRRATERLKKKELQASLNRVYNPSVWQLLLSLWWEEEVLSDTPPLFRQSLALKQARVGSNMFALGWGCFFSGDEWKVERQTWACWLPEFRLPSVYLTVAMSLCKIHSWILFGVTGGWRSKMEFLQLALHTPKKSEDFFLSSFNGWSSSLGEVLLADPRSFLESKAMPAAMRTGCGAQKNQNSLEIVDIWWHLHHFVLQERFCWFWHQISYIRRTSNIW